MSLADSTKNEKVDGTITRNGNATVEVCDAGKTLKVSVKGQRAYSISLPATPFQCGDTYVSADGRSVIWWLSGSFTGHLQDDQPEALPLGLNSRALCFFRNGVLIKFYKYGELLKRTELICEASSHTEWLPKFVRAGKEPKPNPLFSANGEFVSVHTTSFRSYKFRVRDGAMVQRGNSELWKRNAFLGCAKLDFKEGKLLLENLFPLKGSWNGPPVLGTTNLSGSSPSWQEVAASGNTTRLQLVDQPFAFSLRCSCIRDLWRN